LMFLKAPSVIFTAMLRLLPILLLALIGFPADLPAQLFTSSEIEIASTKQFPLAVKQLREFVAVPNDGHFPKQIQANIDWVRPYLEKLGLETEIIRINDVPFVLAQQTYHPNRSTVLFYLQIDGQPVDASQWDQVDPFTATLKAKSQDGEWLEVGDTDLDPETRLFGRSTSDSKGPALSLLNAFAILNDKGVTPAYNVKLILDFQEEMSSPQLPELVRTNKEKLAADRLVVLDGTRHVSNLPTLTFGARGIATSTLRVFGPRQPMHSGQYGNFVPNPVFRLSKLLAGMKDDDGLVLIPGWYDGISLTEEEKKAMNAVPENSDSIAARIGIARPERVGGTYQEALAYPTLNVRGLKAAYVGGAARTIIPDEAIAMIDIRLVPESDGERLLNLLREYVEGSGYHLVGEEPTEAERQKHDKLAALYSKMKYAAYRTPFDSDIGRWLNRALTRTFDARPVNMRTTGGSQPISPFIQALGLPAVSVRIPNPDNNIHAANENLRLGNYLEGIRTCVGVLTEEL
jgi:acetylornithine deacetylase/succinyl-diaminopimelate desuccinylase-like protein